MLTFSGLIILQICLIYIVYIGDRRLYVGTDITFISQHFVAAFTPDVPSTGKRINA